MISPPRKRRRLANGGEWTEWSSTEEGWDEEEEKPETPTEWGSDLEDLEEEVEEEGGEEKAWREVRQMDDADILAVLSELINEELADEDKKREGKKKSNKATEIDLKSAEKAKRRRKGGRKRKKPDTSERIKSEEEKERTEPRERVAEKERLRKSEAFEKGKRKKKAEREIEQILRERERRQRTKESDEWKELAKDEDDDKEVSKRQSSLGPLRGGPRSSSRLKEVIFHVTDKVFSFTI